MGIFFLLLFRRWLAVFDILREIEYVWLVLVVGIFCGLSKGNKSVALFLFNSCNSSVCFLSVEYGDEYDSWRAFGSVVSVFILLVLKFLEFFSYIVFFSTFSSLSEIITLAVSYFL